MNVLKIAWQGVSGFPIRTILTVLSLTVGIVALVSTAAASSTIENAVTQSALLSGGPVATIDVAGAAGYSGLAESARVARQLETQYEGQAHVSLIASLSDAKIAIEGHATSTAINICDRGLRGIRSFPIVRGSWLSDRPYLVPRVVVNEAFAKASNLHVGDSLTVVAGASLKSVVVGVVEDGVRGPEAYVDIDSVKSFLFQDSSNLTSGFEVTAPEANGPQITSRLGQLNSLSSDQEQWDVTRRDTVGELSDTLVTTRSSLFTLGILAAIASILSTANVGLSALRQRSSELSLRRALGATRTGLTTIMVVEAAILGAISGIVAIPISAVLFSGIAATFGAPYGIVAPTYPVTYALLGLGIGILAALLGALAPAVRAAFVPISGIMRE